jgi:hypothetical protein
MPRADDLRFRRLGTRVRVYPQSPVLASTGEPETIWISPPAGTVGAGPEDDRMYVVDPSTHKEPYEPPERPPYRGPVHPPVQPDAAGHFDYLPTGTREFRAVHAYGVLRRVLDIWEGYLRRPMPWHFRQRYHRLEVVPSLEWDNAHSGYGFIETGVEVSESGVFQHYSENFDVLAHELGHSILFSEVGIPAEEQLSAEYLAFNESMSDMIALISVMHFSSVVDRLLDETRGNLYTSNELNRIGEQSETEQIRVASNDLRMSDVDDAQSLDPASSDVHRLGQPVTGALFDILIDLYLNELETLGLVPPWLAEVSRRAPERGLDYGLIQSEFDSAYERDPQSFKGALLDARDYLGFSLAVSWQLLDAANFGFGELYGAMLSADGLLADGNNLEAIREAFQWREIRLETLRPEPSQTSLQTPPAYPPGNTPPPVFEVKGFRRRLPYLDRVQRRLRSQ